MEYCRTCPGCGRTHAFEWHEREHAGWCLICGFFEHFIDFQQYLSRGFNDDSPIC